ncbi:MULTISPECIES: hypothetical protein [Streptomyces]|nr:MULTISPECIES: hypothetical protein [Streptomyces]WGP13482.1 hypothetical protein QFA72_29250 [Streptomyces sp. SH5]GGP46890.1 hypothetical protein GCM10010231_17630 [Streptomyces sindenensis]
MGYDDEGTGADSGIIETMEWAKAEGAGIVSMSSAPRCPTTAPAFGPE